jgi:adenine-specific DNA-methyltransferase
MHEKQMIVFKQTGTSPLIDENGNRSKWNLYTKSYLKDRQQKGTLPRNFLDSFINRKGADLLKKFDINFDFSKPVELIRYLLDISNVSSGDIVLDFFAGSGTTAHAVLDKNIKEGIDIKYILVQLPEILDEDSRKRNPGLTSVSDICRERVRRVVKKINEESKQDSLLFKKEAIDLGFRSLKLTQSNFRAWQIDPQKGIDQIKEQLNLHVENTATSLKQEDLLFEILLKSGFVPSTDIQKLILSESNVYVVSEGTLVVCLASSLTKKLIDDIASLKPIRFVCLDSGFAGNDQLKVNAVETFKAKGITFKTV